MKVAVIIQARMLSMRLPGKVLLPFSDGSTILERLVNGLKLLNLSVIVATSVNPIDDDIVRWCENKGVMCKRGSENNVLERFIQIAQDEQLDSIIRVCADNPFLQFESIKVLINEALINPNSDYISFQSRNGIPAIRMHWGLFGEWVKVSALLKTSQTTAEALYQEHVTNYIYSNPHKFAIRFLDAPIEIWQRDDLRFTVDEIEDFKNMDELITLVGNEPKLQELIQAVDTQSHIKLSMLRAIKKITK